MTQPYDPWQQPPPPRQEALPPPPPQAGPWAPAYGYPYQAPPQSNGLGVAALVLGIVGLLGCWVPIVGALVALVGLVLGIVALSKSRKAQRSNGLAVAGVIISGIALLAGIALSAVILDMFADCDIANSTEAELDACLERQVG